MILAARRKQGFTLIEMMVTLAVIVVLLLVAIPSFQAFRQRAALRAGSEQVLAIWNQSRMEAAKRNSPVKFSRTVGSGNYCVGARVATSSTDTSGCDCTITDTTSSSYCDVARWPSSSAAADQAEWSRVSLAAPSAATDLATAVIEPKHLILGASGQAGSFALLGPSGRKQYKLYLEIDGMGRAVLCQPADAVDKMSDYGARGCTP